MEIVGGAHAHYVKVFPFKEVTEITISRSPILGGEMLDLFCLCVRHSYQVGRLKFGIHPCVLAAKCSDTYHTSAQALAHSSFSSS